MAVARGNGSYAECCSNQRACSGIRIVVSGRESNGRFTVLESLEHRGASHPLHLHHREDELIYVLDGQVSFQQGGVWTAGRAGDCQFLPRGQEHTYVIESERARLLILHTPAGLEDYYQALCEPAGEKCDYQEAERLVVLAARFGVDITGPAPESRNVQAKPGRRVP